MDTSRIVSNDASSRWSDGGHYHVHTGRILRDQRIWSEDRHSMNDRLAYQHAVERVAMERPESQHMKCRFLMTARDWIPAASR